MVEPVKSMGPAELFTATLDEIKQVYSEKTEAEQVALAHAEFTASLMKQLKLDLIALIEGK
ncbi:MAG: hypothetical protein AAF583_02765 [Pseudomonadota bacterium]